MLQEKENQIWQKVFTEYYLIIYSIWLVITFLNTTMFRINYPSLLQIVLIEITVIFVGIKVIFIDKFDRTYILLSILLIVSFGGCFIYTGYVFLLTLLFLIIGAKNIPFKKLIQIYCWITGIFIIITVIASQIGLIENLIYERNGQRISFGFNYPTDFTAHIFFFVMAYSYLRKDKLTYLELLCILGLSVFSYIFCDARTNALCLLLSFAIFLYLKIRNNISVKKGYYYKINANFRKFLVYSLPICAFFIIGMTVLYYYYPDNNIVSSFDNLFSHRQKLGSIGLEKYGVKLFGSSFQMFGFGGKITPPKEYFFLDSSYVLILIRYGVLVLISTIIIFVYSSYQTERQNNIYLLWILALIALQCMIEHHLLEIAYNPFILICFSLKNNYAYTNA